MQSQAASIWVANDNISDQQPIETQLKEQNKRWNIQLQEDQIQEFIQGQLMNGEKCDNNTCLLSNQILKYELKMIQLHLFNGQNTDSYLETLNVQRYDLQIQANYIELLNGEGNDFQIDDKIVNDWEQMINTQTYNGERSQEVNITREKSINNQKQIEIQQQKNKNQKYRELKNIIKNFISENLINTKIYEQWKLDQKAVVSQQGSLSLQQMNQIINNQLFNGQSNDFNIQMLKQELINMPQNQKENIIMQNKLEEIIIKQQNLFKEDDQRKSINQIWVQNVNNQQKKQKLQFITIENFKVENNQQIVLKKSDQKLIEVQVDNEVLIKQVQNIHRFNDFISESLINNKIYQQWKLAQKAVVSQQGSLSLQQMNQIINNQLFNGQSNDFNIQMLKQELINMPQNQKENIIMQNKLEQIIIKQQNLFKEDDQRKSINQIWVQNVNNQQKKQKLQFITIENFKVENNQQIVLKKSDQKLIEVQVDNEVLIKQVQNIHRFNDFISESLINNKIYQQWKLAQKAVVSQQGSLSLQQMNQIINNQLFNGQSNDFNIQMLKQELINMPQNQKENIIMQNKLEQIIIKQQNLFKEDDQRKSINQIWVQNVNNQQKKQKLQFITIENFKVENNQQIVLKKSDQKLIEVQVDNEVLIKQVQNIHRFNDFISESLINNKIYQQWKLAQKAVVSQQGSLSLQQMNQIINNQLFNGQSNDFNIQMLKQELINMPQNQKENIIMQNKLEEIIIKQQNLFKEDDQRKSINQIWVQNVNNQQKKQKLQFITIENFKVENNQQIVLKKSDQKLIEVQVDNEVLIKQVQNIHRFNDFISESLINNKIYQQWKLAQKAVVSQQGSLSLQQMNQIINNQLFNGQSNDFNIQMLKQELINMPQNQKENIIMQNKLEQIIIKQQNLFKEDDQRKSINQIWVQNVNNQQKKQKLQFITIENFKVENNQQIVLKKSDQKLIEVQVDNEVLIKQVQNIHRFNDFISESLINNKIYQQWKLAQKAVVSQQGSLSLQQMNQIINNQLFNGQSNDFNIYILKYEFINIVLPQIQQQQNSYSKPVTFINIPSQTFTTNIQNLIIIEPNNIQLQSKLNNSIRNQTPTQFKLDFIVIKNIDEQPYTTQNLQQKYSQNQKQIILNQIQKHNQVKQYQQLYFFKQFIPENLINIAIQQQFQKELLNYNNSNSFNRDLKLLSITIKDYQQMVQNQKINGQVSDMRIQILKNQVRQMIQTLQIENHKKINFIVIKEYNQNVETIQVQQNLSSQNKNNIQIQIQRKNQIKQFDQQKYQQKIKKFQNSKQVFQKKIINNSKQEELVYKKQENYQKKNQIKKQQQKNSKQQQNKQKYFQKQIHSTLKQQQEKQKKNNKIKNQIIPQVMPGTFQSLIKSYNDFKWMQQNGKINKMQFNKGNLSILIKTISKVKCLSQENEKVCPIKVSYQNNNNSILFYCSPKEEKHGLPLHYIWYSKIVVYKLQEMNIKLDSIKLPITNDFNPKYKDIFVKGLIYKKSQHFFIWQPRYIVVNPQGLFSFKKPTEGSPSFTIKSGDVKYIWTRFQFHQQCLIIKIKHDNTQTQFGIPITNYFYNNDHNWIYAIYKMMMGKKITK